LLFGTTKMQQAMATLSKTPSIPSSLPDLLLEARGLLGRCIELDPSCDVAYLNLGSTFLFDPENVDTGIQYLERAQTLSPWRNDTLLALMGLYLRKDDLARAQALQEIVLRRATDAQEAFNAIHLMDAYRAEQSVRQNRALSAVVERRAGGDYTGAIAALDSIVRSSRDSSFVERARLVRDQT